MHCSHTYAASTGIISPFITCTNDTTVQEMSHFFTFLKHIKCHSISNWSKLTRRTSLIRCQSTLPYKKGLKSKPNPKQTNKNQNTGAYTVQKTEKASALRGPFKGCQFLGSVAAHVPPQWKFCLLGGRWAEGLHSGEIRSPQLPKLPPISMPISWNLTACFQKMNHCSPTFKHKISYQQTLLNNLLRSSWYFSTFDIQRFLSEWWRRGEKS